MEITVSYSKYWCAIIFICFSFNAVVAKEPKRHQIGRFDVGGVMLHLECYGTKAPTVIVHSGFGNYGSQGHWNAVIESISQTNRICVYDRAHMGESDKLTRANNVNDISRRLKNLLLEANINPPYIMVGHSYGSYPVKAYNHLYPDDVLSILLIDPSQYGMWANRINRWQPNKEEYKEEWAVARLKEDFLYWENPERNRGFHDLKMNEAIIKDTNDFDDKPFVLLWAKDGIWDPNNSSFKQRLPKVWQRTKNNYLKAIDRMHSLSTNIKIAFSKTDKHNIHVVEPETVVEQLNYLLSLQFIEEP